MSKTRKANIIETKRSCRATITLDYFDVAVLADGLAMLKLSGYNDLSSEESKKDFDNFVDFMVDLSRDMEDKIYSKNWNPFTNA